MQFKYINKDNFPMVEFILNHGEEIKCESGAVVYYDGGIELEGKRNGSLLGALGKSLLGGENFFKTTAKAKQDNQKIALAPKAFGDIHELQVGGVDWYIEDGAYLAATKDVDYDLTRQQGVGGALFGGTGGFFILKTKGQGSVFVESVGSLIEIELDGTEQFVIDNDHLVAWESSISYSIEVASGLFGFKTGEGLVTKLHGRGKVIIQSRQTRAFAQEIFRFMPQQK
ncbi:MAG: TIGR00266 family protein [Mycoplasmatales bacterium]